MTSIVDKIVVGLRFEKRTTEDAELDRIAYIEKLDEMIFLNQTPSCRAQ